MRKLTDEELDAGWEVVEAHKWNHTGMLLDALREKWPGVVHRQGVGYFVPEGEIKKSAVGE